MKNKESEVARDVKQSCYGDSVDEKKTKTVWKKTILNIGSRANKDAAVKNGHEFLKKIHETDEP